MKRTISRFYCFIKTRTMFSTRKNYLIKKSQGTFFVARLIYFLIGMIYKTFERFLSFLGVYIFGSFFAVIQLNN